MADKNQVSPELLENLDLLLNLEVLQNEKDWTLLQTTETLTTQPPDEPSRVKDDKNEL